MALTVIYDVGTDDLRAYYNHVGVTARTRKAKRQLFATGLVLIVFPLLVIAAMLLQGSAPVQSYLIIVIPAAIAIGFWAVIVRGVIGPILDRSADPDVKASPGAHRLTISADGIREDRPEGHVFHFWKAVTAVDEGPAHVFIAVGPSGHYIVPARAFPDSESRTGFVQELREWVRRGPSVP